MDQKCASSLTGFVRRTLHQRRRIAEALLKPMKSFPFLLLTIAGAISLAYAAPHKVPPGTKLHNSNGEQKNIASAKRLKASGLIGKPVPQMLINDVKAGDHQANIANRMTEPSGTGPSVQIQTGSANQMPRQTQLQPAPQKPAYKPKWRLEGMIIGGKDHAVAVFNFGNDYPVVVHAGEFVDSHTKVLSISAKQVYLAENHRKVTMMPW